MAVRMATTGAKGASPLTVALVLQVVAAMQTPQGCYLEVGFVPGFLQLVGALWQHPGPHGTKGGLDCS